MGRVLTQEERETLRPQAIFLLLAGHGKPKVAARLGLGKTTVLRWSEEAGFSREGHTIRCPSCAGTMERGELFFWRCSSCGVEWWPPEGAVPEEPERWLAPDHAAMDPVAVDWLRRLREQGLGYHEIADELNARGITTPRGARWTRDRVAKHIWQQNMTERDSWTEREEKAVAIARPMAEAGYTREQIAARLNAEGITTRLGRRWTVGTVKWLLRAHGLKINQGAKSQKSAGFRAREDLAWIDAATGAAWARRHPR